MKSKFKIFFICLSLLCSSLYANEQHINLNTIIDNTSKKDKQVVVFFHMSNCGYCERMSNQTFQNKEIQNILQKDFVVVDVNIDHKESIVFDTKRYSKKEFSNIMNVNFFPTVLFFDENYEVTYTVRGYRDNQKFKDILLFIKTKSYESMDFFDFKPQEIEKE